MLPNFTVVICGAVLTVLMLAVAGSGLIDPQTRTRIGAMPEIGRPMMQRMITEPAARGQFAALETSRRADELMRLRDLAPAVADPALTAEHDDPVQPAVESADPASQPPSDAVAAAAASTEAEPTAVAEAVRAAAAEAPPATVAPTASATGAEAAPAPVAIAEPTSAIAVEEATTPDDAAAPAPEDTKLAAEPAVEPPPEAPPVVPPVSTLIAAAPPPEPPAVAEHGEPPAESPAPTSQQLALAEPEAVPAPEAPAKLAARTGEPDEAAPVRRLVPRFVPRLPRIIPALSRLSRPRLAPALPRATPMLTRHIDARARPEAAKQDIAKGAAMQKKLVRHMMREVQHRAQRAYLAPRVSPNHTYSVTSGVQL
jgi:hypothetical protein